MTTAIGRSARRSAAGFSLLELLVALVVMSIALGMLYRAVGGSVRTVGELSRHSLAVSLGESLLSSRDAVPAEGWRESGEWEGLHWSVSSAPLENAEDGELVLHRVQVDLGWGDGLRERGLTLVSLRPQQTDIAGQANR